MKRIDLYLKILMFDELLPVLNLSASESPVDGHVQDVVLTQSEWRALDDLVALLK